MNVRVCHSAYAATLPLCHSAYAARIRVKGDHIYRGNYLRIEIRCLHVPINYADGCGIVVYGNVYNRVMVIWYRETCRLFRMRFRRRGVICFPTTVERIRRSVIYDPHICHSGHIVFSTPHPLTFPSYSWRARGSVCPARNGSGKNTNNHRLDGGKSSKFDETFFYGVWNRYVQGRAWGGGGCSPEILTNSVKK